MVIVCFLGKGGTTMKVLKKLNRTKKEKLETLRCNRSYIDLEHQEFISASSLRIS